MRKFPKSGVKEFNVFKKLDSPQKIQNFVNKLPMNFERKGDTCRSPLTALRHGEAHCMEGAFLAAAALWYHGERPLLMDLRTSRGDDYHVVAVFRRPRRPGRGRRGGWGAISKTNHPVLRYRDPIYKTPRELAASFLTNIFWITALKRFAVIPRLSTCCATAESGSLPKKTCPTLTGPWARRRTLNSWKTAPSAACAGRIPWR